MAGKKKVEGEESAPAGKKKFIVIGALAAVLLAGGVGGGIFLTKGDSASAATKAAAEKPVPGTVTTLDPISLNLADGHYLKIGIALQGVEAEGGGHEGTTGPDGSKALDLTIGEFSGLSMAELSNPEQRRHYQDELQEKIVKAYEEKDDKDVEQQVVMGIYLTQFVMQ